MSLQKAKFYFENKEGDPLDKLFLAAQYNPENLSFSQGASWKKQDATVSKDVSPIQYQNTQPKSLSMDLIWDLTNSGQPTDDVAAKFVRQFENALLPTIKLTKPYKSVNKSTGKAANTTTHRPPRIRFKWGKIDMISVIKTLKTEYLMFAPDGRALRAKMSITLEEYQEKFVKPELKGSMGGYNISQVKLVQVQKGQTLSGIAQMAGMSTAALAELNGIDNPLALAAGAIIKIPTT
ncbi:MAG: LysM peptidoglycan-binding domain-containing protein [Myxococcota bacterium]|nr:LysM peptidoglycan-binding domain-containing protein [Myxococcota bacterium]